MVRTSFLCIILSSFVTTAFAEEPVYFADENLKAAVEQALGVSYPTPTDMLALTRLDASNRLIVDLTGLEHATNMKWLVLNYNQIDDISALSALTNLTELYLLDSRVSDISALTGLTELIHTRSTHKSDQRHLCVIGTDESDEAVPIQKSDQRYHCAVWSD